MRKEAVTLSAVTKDGPPRALVIKSRTSLKRESGLIDGADRPRQAVSFRGGWRSEAPKEVEGAQGTILAVRPEGPSHS